MRKRNLNLAIVTTIADARDSIYEFIYYHLSIGFSRLYIFVDDNDEDVIKIAEGFPQVSVTLRDDYLYEKWKNTPSYLDNNKKKLINEEVMVRQEMNFHLASIWGKKEGVDWLLHIDIDELFYPNNLDLTDYFLSLQKQGIASVTFLNYESISTSENSESTFSSRHFKINFFKRGHLLFSKEQRNYIQSNSWLRNKYFNYYQNGKSIINVTGKKIYFYDVHSIMADGRRLLGGHTDPLILHFPCSRYVDFSRKYARLGDFSDVWMGYQRAGDFIEKTHLESRDIFKNNDQAMIKKFYADNFILNDTQIGGLLEMKMAITIDFHLNFLGTISNSNS